MSFRRYRPDCAIECALLPKRVGEDAVYSATVVVTERDLRNSAKGLSDLIDMKMLDAKRALLERIMEDGP